MTMSTQLLFLPSMEDRVRSHAMPCAEHTGYIKNLWRLVNLRLTKSFSQWGVQEGGLWDYCGCMMA